MIRFTTIGSQYEVTVQSGLFHVKKIAAIKPTDTFNVVGQTRVSKLLALECGKPAFLDVWQTSNVHTIEDL